MNQNQALEDELWNGEKCICCFVHSGQFFWVVDYKYNFCLDAEVDYLAYLEKGHINKTQFIDACNAFRGGLLKLTESNFNEYLRLKSTTVLNKVALKNIFDSPYLVSHYNLLDKVEKLFVSGIELLDEDFKKINKVAVQLPKFYINFDRKMYFHMDIDRCHEGSSYADWHAKYLDFHHLIPDEQRYWIQGNRDFWKLKYI